jgi:hypothetical protein
MLMVLLNLISSTPVVNRTWCLFAVNWISYLSAEILTEFYVHPHLPSRACQPVAVRSWWSERSIGGGHSMMSNGAFGTAESAAGWEADGVAWAGQPFPPVGAQDLILEEQPERLLSLSRSAATGAAASASVDGCLSRVRTKGVGCCWSRACLELRRKWLLDINKRWMEGAPCLAFSEALDLSSALVSSARSRQVRFIAITRWQQRTTL